MPADTRTRRGNPLHAALVLAVAAGVFFIVYTRQLAGQFLYRPPPHSFYERDEDFLNVLRSDGSEINVFWARGDLGDWSILYCCGSNEDLAAAMPRLRSYQLRGFNVAGFEYPGYGYTEGEPGEGAFYRDGLAVYDFLTREIGLPESQLVVHGHSVGAGVALEIASRRIPAGLILESAFTSAYDLVTGMNWLPGDLFENDLKAPKTNCPVLLIHGGGDSVVPLSNSLALGERFRPGLATRLDVPDAGHGDIAAAAGTSYWASIERFVRKLGE